MWHVQSCVEKSTLSQVSGRKPSSSPGLLWTHSGLHRDTVTPPEPKQWERQQPQAISTPLLLAELPFSTLTAINVPEILVLGLIDCLIEKVNILPPAHNPFMAQPLEEESDLVQQSRPTPLTETFSGYYA